MNNNTAAAIEAANNAARAEHVRLPERFGSKARIVRPVIFTRAREIRAGFHVEPGTVGAVTDCGGGSFRLTLASGLTANVSRKEIAHWRANG